MNESATISRVRGLIASGQARRIRLNSHLELSEVARDLDVSPTTVWRWENGQRSPRGSVALRYARLLKRLDGALAVEREWGSPPGTADAAFAPEGEAPEIGGVVSPAVEGSTDV